MNVSKSAEAKMGRIYNDPPVVDHEALEEKEEEKKTSKRKKKGGTKRSRDVLGEEEKNQPKKRARGRKKKNNGVDEMEVEQEEKAEGKAEGKAEEKLRDLPPSYITKQDRISFNKTTEKLKAALGHEPLPSFFVLDQNEKIRIKSTDYTRFANQLGCVRVCIIQ